MPLTGSAAISAYERILCTTLIYKNAESYFVSSVIICEIFEIQVSMINKFGSCIDPPVTWSMISDFFLYILTARW